MVLETYQEKVCEFLLPGWEAETLPQQLSVYADKESLCQAPLNQRLTSALIIFLDQLAEMSHPIHRVDQSLIDHMIQNIDQHMGALVDEILHDPAVQKLEARWRSLDYLLRAATPSDHVQIEILDVSKAALSSDFQEADDIEMSSLYHHVYTQEYDTPGGEPFSSVITDEEFDNTPEDMNLLRQIARVAEAAHCPFIGNVGHQFFGKQSIEELSHLYDIREFLDKPEYVRWQILRKESKSRYIGLTLPKFMLRLPYADDNNKVKSFAYHEQASIDSQDKFLWGAASFAFAANMARAFQESGWTINIRGPESGGRLDGLPMHAMPPVQMVMPESKEVAFASEGFIPLSYYKNTSFACFFSANALHQPPHEDNPQQAANQKINNRLPYIYLVSRLAQYLKIIQRENIGSQKSREHLEYELNAWISTLVTKTQRPSPEVMAQFPLAAAQIIVKDMPDNPGYYHISMSIVPHFQVEGMDITLSLVSRLPHQSQYS